MQAVLPVILALRRGSELDMDLFGTGASRALLDDYGLASETLDEDAFAHDPADTIGSLLDQLRPELAISGSSPARGPGPETPEQYLIQEARRRGIPSIGVLDTWGLYRERFGGRDGAIDSDLVPDLLCVLDRLCFEELVGLGMPAENLRVTNNPWLDLLGQSLGPARSAKRSMTGQGRRVLFVSQPLAEFRSCRGWPYDQEDILRGLVRALSEADPLANHEVRVWAHPAETPGRWHGLDRFSRTGVDLMLDDKRGRSVFSEVDVVVTSHSTVMYEALHYDTPCISFRPGGEDLEPLVCERLGLSHTFNSVASLRRFLAGLDLGAESRRLAEARRACVREQMFYNDGKATSRVVAEVHGLLRQRRAV